MSNETRKLPTRPGWWLAKDPTFDGGRTAAYEVYMTQYGPWIRDHGAIADLEFEWLAPIPGPAVLAALAEYGEALVGADTSQPKSRERVLARGRLVEAGIAMANAIRAERDGAS